MSFAHKDPRTKKLTGRYEVDFWYRAPGEPDKRMHRVFADKKTADANEAYAKQRGMWADHEAGAEAGVTFAEAAAEMRRVHPAWLKKRDKSGQKRLDWALSRFGHKAIKSVTTKDLQDMVDDLKKRPVPSTRNPSGIMKGRTLNGYLTMVSAVLTFAASRPKEYGTFVPPVIPWQDAVKTRIQFMTKEQQGLLIKFYMEKGWTDEAVMARALAESGMRWSELEGLTPNMIQITTRHNGASIGWIKLDETKTDTPRDIPVTPQLARDLRGLLQNGYSPNYDRSRYRYSEARKMYGWNPLLSMYGIRHAAATYLTKAGMQPEKVQQFMGHKDYNTTKQYIHLESEDLAEAVEFLTPTYGYEAEMEPETNVVSIGKAS